MFFVKKSDGVRIRLIIDARRGNSRFRDPPGMSQPPLKPLPGSSLTTGRTFSPRRRAVTSHRFRLGSLMSRIKGWFTYLGDHLLKQDVLVWPMPAPLCVGFSWSLYFAQKANQRLMSGIPSLASSRLFSDRSQPVVIATDKVSQVQPSHHYVYVDNLECFRLTSMPSKKLWFRLQMSSVPMALIFIQETLRRKEWIP